jgi:hypothetical protein
MVFTAIFDMVLKRKMKKKRKKEVDWTWVTHAVSKHATH